MAEGKASTEEAIAKSKISLKEEVASELKEGLFSSAQFQDLLKKNTVLEEKIKKYSAKIATLEMKTQQFEVELPVAARSHLGDQRTSVLAFQCQYVSFNGVRATKCLRRLTLWSETPSECRIVRESQFEP